MTTDLTDNTDVNHERKRDLRSLLSLAKKSVESVLSVFEKNKRNGFIRFICLAGAVIFSRFTSDKSDTSVSLSFLTNTEDTKETEV